MIVCFQCPQRTKKLIDQFVAKGHYTDVSQAIVMAIENLAVLQDEIPAGGHLILSENSLHTKSEAGNRKYDGECEQGTPTVRKTSNFISALTVPTIFGLPTDVQKLPTVTPPDDFYSPGDVVPLRKWPFAMFNRILPLKANCRALINILPDYPKGIEIKRVASMISSEARALGDLLQRRDQEVERDRDSAYSTAFPLSTDADDASMRRYANQFVGTINKKGIVTGMPFTFKFVNYTGGMNPKIQLTDAGEKFALLPNPILDAPWDREMKRFSDEEVDFLLKHIAECVPAEDYAYRYIIDSIKNGQDSPSQIDQSLMATLNEDERRDLTQSFLSSQRSGVISRMSELGLLGRLRDGVTVRYTLTGIAERFSNNS